MSNIGLLWNIAASTRSKNRLGKEWFEVCMVCDVFYLKLKVVIAGERKLTSNLLNCMNAC